MNQRTKVRRVGTLCCHTVRNIAYYRAGWVDGDFVSGEDFWRNANSNFLDIAVLEWCKLFGERNGKHHWRKVVPDPDVFLPTLRNGINITEEEFNEHCNQMKTYRNKFVAHLDNQPVMHIPRLTMVIDSTVFLYGLIRGEFEEFLADAPANLREFYEERKVYGRGFYPHAP